MSVYIIAFGILLPLAILIVVGWAFWKRQKNQKKLKNNDQAQIKAVAKTHLRSLNIGPTRLLSTLLLSAPKPKDKNKRAFYLYFTYELLTKDLTLEEVLLVTIEEFKTRHERVIETKPTTELVSAALKQKVIKKLQNLKSKR